MPRLFGTDGVRGLANRELTADLALGLAQAAAAVLTKGRRAEERRAAGRRPVAVVARDPRISGEFLTAAVSAGLASSGVDVLDAGVVPTPAAAFLIADIGADFGVMLSASHNPAPDNGIKFFAFGGTKLPDEVEDRIEAYLDKDVLLPTGGDVGRIRRFADAEDRYVLHLLGTLPNRLDGIHVVLDCAHGAASGVSPEVFTNAGARITLIGADPDGMNINDGVGSTHLDNLAKAVLEHGADVGIAHDGDADRCL
ncbi:MAG TPA: phosphoglucosamine mutase, partial [Microterricola sp.]